MDEKTANTELETEMASQSNTCDFKLGVAVLR